jgi:hypothetical protein
LIADSIPGCISSLAYGGVRKVGRRPEAVLCKNLASNPTHNQMKMTTNFCLVCLASLMVLRLRADVLELKSGQVLTGKYLGGTAGTLRFDTGYGLQVIETGQALALTFTGGDAPASPPPEVPTPVTAPVPPPVATTLTVNAGTALLVRMVDGASSRDSQGKRFTTTLETDLVVNGTMVARAGTRIYGRVGRPDVTPAAACWICG